MILYLFFFFAFGLILGSFGNVCIHRIPREESLWRPRSRCPSCLQPIAWHDNIPVLSFLLLGRKCRRCGHSISWRYPLFELLTGCAFMLVAWQYAFHPLLAVYLAFTFLLIIISGIDLSHQVIPDALSFSIVLIGLTSSVFNASLGDAWHGRMLQAALGMLAGGGILLLFAWGGKIALGQEALGGGDVKLLAGIGALLGWQKALSTLLIASLLGSIIGISLIAARRMQRRDYLPFGPFIAFGAYLNLFLPDLVTWYFSFLEP